MKCVRVNLGDQSKFVRVSELSSSDLKSSDDPKCVMSEALCSESSLTLLHAETSVVECHGFRSVPLTGFTPIRYLATSLYLSSSVFCEGGTVICGAVCLRNAFGALCLRWRLSKRNGRIGTGFLM